MLRASAACEAAGIPTASLVCEGFVKQFAATSVGLGVPNIPHALMPGHPSAQSEEERRRNILETTVEQVISNLTRAPAAANAQAEPAARDIFFVGGFQAVNRHFYEHGLNDGLPIVPPTRLAVEAFLRFTDRDPDQVLGVILPDSRAATIWSIAVNGVMAGCRPEYMPILVALVEAMVDHEYGVEHSGNTGGGETLILLNGPIVKQLGFNYTQGALRDGFLPNTSVGRFWRLYLRNVAGFLLHQSDKATYGDTWRVVLAENEDVISRIGWEPASVESGFAAGDNTVTIARYLSGITLASVSGTEPAKMLPYLADALAKQASWKLTFTVGPHGGTLRPRLVLSPIIAETIAKAGWSKLDVKRFLFEHARIPAFEFERMLRDWTDRPTWNLAEEVQRERLPKLFHESDDPGRLVPVFWKPEDILIAVAGDPLRTNAYAFASNGAVGFPVGKRIELPREWDRLLGESAQA
ncbi:MAG TPA: UGSC family (seleno)protein [Burkholderiales bacterium]|nr:UGSC family (seleno)protein [Burkholderiales bacterium]